MHCHACARKCLRPPPPKTTHTLAHICSTWCAVLHVQGGDDAAGASNGHPGAPSSSSAPQAPLRVEAYTPPDPGPYPADQPKQNSVRFTPVQVEAITAGVQPGLTMVVGPPGTGKTDTAVQIMHVLYHNCPQQRTLLVTHSNQALNDLFSKIMQRDVPSRYLLRLGERRASGATRAVCAGSAEAAARARMCVVVVGACMHARARVCVECKGWLRHACLPACPFVGRCSIARPAATGVPLLPLPMACVPQVWARRSWRRRATSAASAASTPCWRGAWSCWLRWRRWPNSLAWWVKLCAAPCSLLCARPAEGLEPAVCNELVATSHSPRRHVLPHGQGCSQRVISVWPRCTDGRTDAHTVLAIYV